MVEFLWKRFLWYWHCFESSCVFACDCNLRTLTFSSLDDAIFWILSLVSYCWKAVTCAWASIWNTHMIKKNFTKEIKVLQKIETEWGVNKLLGEQLVATVESAIKLTKGCSNQIKEHLRSIDENYYNWFVLPINWCYRMLYELFDPILVWRVLALKKCVKVNYR